MLHAPILCLHFWIMRYVITVLLLLYSVHSQAADYSIDTVSIKSKVLGEERIILLYSPEKSFATDSVMLVYLIDGEFSEYRFDALVDNKSSNRYIGISIMNTDRRRDLLAVNEADQFLEFIAEEFIPHVEKDFTAVERVLFGHSFGGAFSIFAMLNHPGLFNKYIASSPTPIMDMTDSPLYLQLDDILKEDITFYYSHGAKDMKQVRKWCDRLHENMLELSLEHIGWKYEIFEGENHNTSDVISFKRGIGFQ